MIASPRQVHSSSPAGTTGRERLVSLDVFRGGTVAAMILVNNQISAQPYPPLQHAEWHGWTFTDLVFPSFLWIVGVAMTLSLAKRVERGDNRERLLAHVVRRAATIFALGLLLNLLPHLDFAGVRIPGVLQRIAVCYLCAAPIFLYFGTRGRIVWSTLLLGVYWFLMTIVDVPGCGAGSFSVDCNFAKWIDGLVLSGHMWSRSKTWDPEGIVSTLPAIVNTLLGIFAGQILASRRTSEARASWLFLFGNSLILAGLMLSAFMPVNKQLWTPPYALLSSGIACAVFASCYWLIDIQNRRRYSTPFVILGVNALAMFVISGMLGRIVSIVHIGQVPLSQWLWRNVYSTLGSEASASLLYGLTHVMACFLVAWVMYRRRWILKV